jgi:hypothetical protein
VTLSSIKASLTRKLGPLPAYAWLGIFAAAVLLWRHLHPPAPTSASAAATPDLGPLADTSNPSPGYFGGSGGGGLDIPTDQAFADPGLTGPGTAVVFDPTTGLGPSSNDQEASTIPRDTTPGNSAGGRVALTIAGGLDPAIATAVLAGKGPTYGDGAVPPPHPKKRPSGKGQKPAPAPELISEHGKGQATIPKAAPKVASKPVAVAKAAPARSVQSAAAPVAVAVPRSAVAVQQEVLAGSNIHRGGLQL